MKSLIELKTAAPPLLFTFALLCFGPLPKAQAVSPPPDGGYSGGNTAEGQNALLSLTTGGFNTAVGYFSLRSDTTTGFNTATGAGALFANTGSNNTAIGAAALLGNTTASQNIALGAAAGVNQVTGSNNIYIGDAGTPLDNNLIAIGNIASSGTAYQQFYVGAVYGVTTASTTTLPVIVSSDGQLGTAPSAARFKKEIKPMDKASDSVLALKPVTFQYKSDKTNTRQFGLVADEVAKVNPDLVVRDKNGEIYTVRYDAVNAMLLNEFLKAHRKIEEQGATIAKQQKQIEALTAGLQKVSTQIEASKPAPQVVNNP
jgi:Chaperone of endosialidase